MADKNRRFFGTLPGRELACQSLEMRHHQVTGVRVVMYRQHTLSHLAFFDMSLSFQFFVTRSTIIERKH
jgi:hypothetical protein